MNVETLGFAVALTTGLVEVVKTIGLPSRFAPLCAIVIGVGASALLSGGFPVSAITFGIIAGLTSAGLYSGVKTTVKPTDEQKTTQTAQPTTTS